MSFSIDHLPSDNLVENGVLNLTVLVDVIEALQTDSTEIRQAVDDNMAGTLSVFIALSAINVLTMQLGFALLEAGSVRSKHVKSILLKNLVDGCVGTLGWWSVGYSVYSGMADFDYNTFMDTTFTNDDGIFIDWFLLNMFAITTSTIMSGAVVSRVNHWPYLVQTLWLNAFVFPLIAHWVWGEGGWLNGKFVDFAGGTAVHGLGGWYSLVACWYAGPRVGRFIVENIDGKIVVTPKQIPGCSPANQLTGGLLLYFCWFSFNGVSSLSIEPDGTKDTWRACMNTLLCSTGSVLAGLVHSFMFDGHYKLDKSVNCLLIGLVSITSGCRAMDTRSAFLVGTGSALLLVLSDKIMLRFRLDDPLSAFSIHGVGGVYGSIMTGVFSSTGGLIVGESELFLWQIAGSFSIVLVSLSSSFLANFILYRWMPGGLLVPMEFQVLGLDFLATDISELEGLGKDQIREFNLRKRALEKIKHKQLKAKDVGGFGWYYQMRSGGCKNICGKKLVEGKVAPSSDSSGAVTTSSKVSSEDDKGNEEKDNLTRMILADNL